MAEVRIAATRRRQWESGNSDRWNACSRILTESRRMRAFASELRASMDEVEDPDVRQAIEQYARTLERTSALGDVSAATLTGH